jgi:hypothetical protein
LAATLARGKSAGKAVSNGTLNPLKFMTANQRKVALVGAALAALVATPVVWQEKVIAKRRAENRTIGVCFFDVPELCTNRRTERK